MKTDHSVGCNELNIKNIQCPNGLGKSGSAKEPIEHS